MSDTKNIPEKIREEVLARDQYQCVRCGSTESLTLHHILFRGQGGDHSAENLVTLCFWCHRKLHDGKVRGKQINGLWYFSV
jgi:5-methylcytosine-specific restriction endonuclease McrA